MVWLWGRADFERLVDEHLPDTLHFALRLTNSPDLAEEIVQDAMVSATRNWKTFRGDSTFRTWLWRIVINVYRDRFRKQRTHEQVPDRLVDPGQRDPSELAAAEELGKLIATRVSLLPRRQREVLVLAVYECIGPSEIAEILGIRVENVHATLYQARKRLRQELDQYLTKS